MAKALFILSVLLFFLEVSCNNIDQNTSKQDGSNLKVDDKATKDLNLLNGQESGSNEYSSISRTFKVADLLDVNINIDTKQGICEYDIVMRYNSYNEELQNSQLKRKKLQPSPETKKLPSDTDVVDKDTPPLKTDFEFNIDSSNGIKIENIELLVDGTKPRTGSYSVLNNYKTIRFNQAPEEGTLVKLFYTKKIPILTYPLPNSNARFISLKNEAGTDIEFTKQDNRLLIDLSNFKDGKKLKYRYEDLDISDSKIHIDHTPLLETLKINGATVDNSKTIWDSSSHTLSIDSNILKNQKTLTISYTYIVERRKKFSIDELDPTQIYNWTVLMNDIPVGYKDYDISENTIEFKQELPLDALVTLKASRENKNPNTISP